MRLLTLEEVRDSFPTNSRPSLETLRRKIRSGNLAGQKVGSTWYVSERALQHWFERTAAPAQMSSYPVQDQLKLNGREIPPSIDGSQKQGGTQQT
jgi:hypothetical protein